MSERPWKWRMIVRGAFLDAWLDAPAEERRDAFTAWVEVHRSWQEKGCRLIATMDDLTTEGPTSGSHSNFYTMWEIPNPDILDQLLSPFWSDAAAQKVKLARYFTLELLIGKPIVSMENALGGPLAATPPSGPGEFQ